MRAIYYFIIFSFIQLTLAAQVKFDILQLEDPKKFGSQIAAQLTTIELPVYRDTVKKCIYLKNGFRSSKFVNEKEWLSIRDTVDAYRVDVVYSKYPLRKGVYSEIYPLLCNRLISLFEMDNNLNETELEWNKVLQTHCLNDAQVNSLFHGVVIWYRTIHEEPPAEELISAKAKMIEKIENDLISDQNTLEELNNSVAQIMASPYFPDSLKTKLATESLSSQIEGIKTYLENELKNAPEVELKNANEEDLKRYEKEVDDFLARYKVNDEVVSEVFNRHPEWRNVLVVNDWTGSMYGYGAQVLHWHLTNFEKSGIHSITVFNDGDNKANTRKRIGTTGGIYSDKADNIPKIVKLFNYVMLRGGGSDTPENDVEAILTAMETYTSFSEVVLIADNNSCVRDIELADRIGQPVKVILCGYDKEIGVNPDYVYLAKITGGGIYTIEDDLESIGAVLGSRGEVVDLSDTRFKITSNKCSDMWLSKYGGTTYTNYKVAGRHKRKIYKLRLEEKGLDKVPRKVYKMKRLKYLNLAHNNISAVSPKIYKLQYLKNIDLSFNRINDLPWEFRVVRFIETINLSNNELKSFPESILHMGYMKDLNLSHNQISNLDKNMNLIRLEKLDLSYNQIQKLSNKISYLRKLRELNCSNNNLSSIAENFTRLSKLEILDLSNNNLSALPSYLPRLRNLKVLLLNGNSFSEKEKERIIKSLPYTKITF